ncbi:cysteine hydrolase (plasmid) [Klebsiella sp. WOUb02]|uniref:cysteine hydrolase n=1 Tax=Klebsiella sp. WOUb02 TaxID=3161071 RepID=UPI003CFA7AAB
MKAMKPSALILIEYQNEWLSPSGKLNHLIQDREQLDASVSNSRAVLAAARKREMEIIHVTMTLEPTYKLFGRAEYGLRAAIPQAQTWFGEPAGIHPDFMPFPDEYVIRERAGASAFAGTTLDSYLRNNRINVLYLSGYALHVCVESTLRQAHDLGYTTNVIYDASSAFTREQQNHVVKDIVHHYGRSLTTAEFVKGDK